MELLEGNYDHSNGNISERQRFYSVSSGQTLAIHLTQSESLWNRFHRGVFSHYIPFRDFSGDTLSFFNPLTNDQFSLPWPSLCIYPRMIWTGTDPIRNRSIVMLDSNHQLRDEIWACYDPHSNKWVEQEGEILNCCYWQGMVFSTNCAFVTEIFDVSLKKLLHTIPPPEYELGDNYLFDVCFVNSYLIESLGIILRVSWFYGFRDKSIVEDSILRIYKLDFDGLDGQPCWVRVDNIGNQIMFLQDTTGFSMTARPSTGFREGCIYFIYPGDDKPYVHDILAGTIERVPCPFKRCTWFLPSVC